MPLGARLRSTTELDDAGRQLDRPASSAIDEQARLDTTAIFITYDDCGCFYDHVPPPPGSGIRVPMVIVSPYAKPAFTDSKAASFASILAFTEHLFGLEPLGSWTAMRTTTQLVRLLPGAAGHRAHGEDAGVWEGTSLAGGAPTVRG